MKKETYESLKAIMTYVNVQGIPMKNVGIIDAQKQVCDWIDEVAKEYKEG